MPTFDRHEPLAGLGRVPRTAAPRQPASVREVHAAAVILEEGTAARAVPQLEAEAVHDPPLGRADARRPCRAHGSLERRVDRLEGGGGDGRDKGGLLI